MWRFWVVMYYLEPVLWGVGAGIFLAWCLSRAY